MALDAAAIKNLFSQVVSHAKQLNIFADVNGPRPGESPGQRRSLCGLAFRHIPGCPAASGLAATSGRVEFTGHIYTKPAGPAAGSG